MNSADMERIAAFVERLVDDPSQRGVAAALADDPGVHEVLLGFVHARFVLGEEGFGELEDDPIFWRLIAIGVSGWPSALKQRFVAETLFAAAAPDAYRWLAPLARAVLRAEDAEREILAVIERGSESARVNASHLAYHLFDGSEDYAPSEIGKKRLADADPLGPRRDG